MADRLDPSSPQRASTPGPACPGTSLQKLERNVKYLFAELQNMEDNYGPSRPGRNSLVANKFDIFILTMRTCYVSYYSLKLGQDAYEYANESTAHDSLHQATGAHLETAVRSLGDILRLMSAVPSHTIQGWFDQPPSVHVPRSLFTK